MTSSNWVLEHELGLALGRAAETNEPAIANREEVNLLGLAAEAPVLVVRRLASMAIGESIESVMLVLRGDT